MLYRFHANLFAMPNEVTATPPIELRGAQVSPLAAAARDAFFATTFEESLRELAALPRLDAEPDGFFVIAGDDNAVRWQVDGHLFDFGDRLHRVELHGSCPSDVFDAILRCVGWPATPLAFELVQEGVALCEKDFRAWASA